MTIVRSLTKDGNLYPSVFNIISQQVLPADVLHHQEHRLRHPLGIYDISFYSIIQAFTTVLDALEPLNAALTDAQGALNFDPQPYLKGQKDLLDSLLAHIDDCYHILKSLHPLVPTRRSIPFADAWLAEVKHPTVQSFTAGISSYRDTLAPIVTRLKHQHGRLRAVIFYGPRNRIPGYYLEGIDNQEALGPDPSIHPGNTAFSLYRDLRYHFVRVYEVGEHLRQAVVGAIRRQYNIRLPRHLQVEHQNSELERVAERVSTLPFQFFPDEVAKPTPRVSLKRDDARVTLTLEYPAPIVAFGPGSMRVQSTFQGDSVTRTFRLPYMNSQP